MLDESERHLIDAVIGAVTSWAIHRRFFAGRNHATPQLVVWVDREMIQTVALPTSKFDIVVRVTGVDQTALSRRLERITQSLADGDVVALRLVGTVPDTPTMYSGSATITSAGREDAVRRLCTTFELAGMTLIRRETAPGGGVPFLHFEASGPLQLGLVASQIAASPGWLGQSRDGLSLRMWRTTGQQPFSEAATTPSQVPLPSLRRPMRPRHRRRQRGQLQQPIAQQRGGGVVA